MFLFYVNLNKIIFVRGYRKTTEPDNSMGRQTFIGVQEVRLSHESRQNQRVEKQEDFIRQ